MIYSCLRTKKKKKKTLSFAHPEKYHSILGTAYTRIKNYVLLE